MSNESSATAKTFWKSRTSYPSYLFLKERRLYEVQYLLKHLVNAKSVLDYGCGDGSCLLLLKELSNIKKFFGVDISPALLKIAEQKTMGTAQLFESDFTNVCRVPIVDVTLSLGVLPYIFNEAKVKHYLSMVASPKIIIRTPCSLDNNVEINKFSKELQADYAAMYRSVPDIISYLTDWNITHIVRAYPDEIESKYGTKHYFFVGERK